MPKKKIFEFFDEIHKCQVKKIKKQEFEIKFNLCYIFTELHGVPKMEHQANTLRKS